MAEHLWSVACHEILTNPDTGAISLVDVAEELSVAGLEKLLEEAQTQGKKGIVVKAPLKVFSSWYRSDPDERELRARVVLQDPAGENLLKQTVKVAWGDDTLFSRVLFFFDLVAVSSAGLYWFIVEQQKRTESKKPRWGPVAKFPLYIKNR
jgi:hypothetical protein